MSILPQKFFYKITVAYDGTAYAGWQIQPNQTAITNVLQSRFKKIFGQEAIIVGASRTDAGVHALGQIAVCRTSIGIDDDKMKWAWNNRLPNDIIIRSLIAVDNSFHPQRNVKQKTYWYHFFLERPLPLVQRYGFYVSRTINLDKLRECLAFFVGTYNFRSFCTGDQMGTDTTRTIDSIELSYISRYKGYRIQVKGKSFLRYMIRRIVGACITVASKPHISVEYLKDVLYECNPCQQLPTAPAHGLILYKICYNQGD